MKYPTFESWFDEIEIVSSRQMRFLEEWDNGMDEKRMTQWLRAAFECGREGIDPFDYWKLNKDLS